MALRRFLLSLAARAGPPFLPPSRPKATEAATGNEAVERLRAGPPDLILLDMFLPGGSIDGWVLLETIHNTPDWAAIPVIIITGLGVASPEWARALGALDVVRKPVHVDEVLQKLRRIDC